MKVNPQCDIAGATPSARPERTHPPAKHSEATDFNAARALSKKLTDTPEIRADQITRAKALISDPNYPDANVIQQVARQLAREMETPSPEAPGGLEK